jgi:hypothetical protein
MNALDLYGLTNAHGWRMMPEQDYLNAILLREQIGLDWPRPPSLSRA